MAFVVETGSGLSNATSYGSVAGLESYWADRGGLPVLSDAKATGTLRMYFQPTAGDTVVIGTETYALVASLTQTTENQVLIGAAVTNTQSNLVAAINGAGTPGTDYSIVTQPHADVSIGTFSNGVATITARTAGSDGDAIATTETFTHASNVFDAATLEGATAALETRLIQATDYLDLYTYLGIQRKLTQSLQWPRSGAYDTVDHKYVDSDSIPAKLASALYELAVLDTTALLVDIEAGTVTGDVVETERKIGSLSTRTRYAEGVSATGNQPIFTRARTLIRGLLVDSAGFSIGRSFAG